MLLNNSVGKPPQPKMYLYRDYKHLARLFYSGAVFVAFDTETTGLHSETDYLMEVGAIKFTCNGEISRFDQLIKPPIPILPFLTNLTHITNEMVKDCPSASKVLPDFLRFIGDKNAVLLAHNAPFDLGFLNVELVRMSVPTIHNQCIDTLPLARWAYPKFINETEKGPYKLQSLAKRFEIQVLAAHRADDDARVLMELFKRIIKDTIPRQKDFDMHSQSGNLMPQNIQLELF